MKRKLVLNENITKLYMLKNKNIFYSRLGERQAMLRAAGAIVGMGGKRINDSANSGKYNIVLETKGYSHYTL